MALVVAGTLAACAVFGMAALAALGLRCLDECSAGLSLWPILLLAVPVALLVLTALVARGVGWAGLMITAIGIVASVAAFIVAAWPLAVVGLPLMLGGTMIVSPLRSERP
jgi:hypothetical protein